VTYRLKDSVLYPQFVTNVKYEVVIIKLKIINRDLSLFDCKLSAAQFKATWSRIFMLPKINNVFTIVTFWRPNKRNSKGKVKTDWAVSCKTQIAAATTTTSVRRWVKHNRPLWVAVQGLIRPTPYTYKEVGSARRSEAYTSRHGEGRWHTEQWREV
jgi:hypothetical protein